jgi:putative nucleotidyltransferase with HDIG domain
MRRDEITSKRAIRFRILAGLLSAVTVAAFVYAVITRDTVSHAHIRDAIILAILGVIAEEMAVWVAEKVTMTAANLPILLAVMFTGRVPAICVAAVVGAWGAWRETTRTVAVYNTANLALSTFLAATAFGALQHALAFPLTRVTPWLLVSGVVCGAVYESADMTLAGIGIGVKYGRSLGSFWRDEMRPFLQSLAVLTGVGMVVAALYAPAGVVVVVLLFVPLFASQYMFKLLVREREHLSKQRELSDQYLEMNIGLAAAMVVLLDSKDEYTASHSAAVAMYCRDMAEALDLPDSDVDVLHLAGLLHDLGKVGTPDAVLQKDGPLNEEDWAYIRQHPEKGAEVLSHLATYQSIADIVRYHHERLDGSGYPSGAKSEEIPELSKMLAVADTYHAMTSDRPYRAARSSFEAFGELRALADISLDGKYIEVLARVLRDKNLAYRDGSSTDFMQEYERGRINLRLRGAALTDVSGVRSAQEDQPAG